jgi:hypothetical protein
MESDHWTRDGVAAGPAEVELAHLRNVGYGCYNFAVRRA